MSTSRRADNGALADATVLVVGVGGLGCPAALALMAAGVGRLLLADDDVVEWSNLHRQVLYSDEDVGTDKLTAAKRSLEHWLPESTTRIETFPTRLLPDNALELVKRADVVLEGADNFATKFLAADACALEKRTVVHGSAIRWRATVWSVAPIGEPCYRCLFEDVPKLGAGEPAANCATAGVMAPVTGLAGALMADLALRAIVGKSPGFGAVHTYDGQKDELRAVKVSPRKDCPLCGNGSSAGRTINDITEARYLSYPSCAS
jgi:molybdopterin/thiamine biosynthesis adenylyltransferase